MFGHYRLWASNHSRSASIFHQKMGAMRDSNDEFSVGSSDDNSATDSSDNFTADDTTNNDYGDEFSSNDFSCWWFHWRSSQKRRHKPCRWHLHGIWMWSKRGEGCPARFLVHHSLCGSFPSITPHISLEVSLCTMMPLTSPSPFNFITSSSIHFGWFLLNFPLYHVEAPPRQWIICQGLWDDSEIIRALAVRTTTQFCNDLHHPCGATATELNITYRYKFLIHQYHPENVLDNNDAHLHRIWEAYD